MVDSSAVIAVFRQEHDADHIARRIATDDDPVMSAANLAETSIVLRGLKDIPAERAGLEISWSGILNQRRCAYPAHLVRF